MAPLTRSAAKAGGPLQARAKSEPQVLWFGEENSDQDLCIRLVRNKGNDDHTLALFMVHSSLVEKCSTYFQARLDPERWGSKRKGSSDEITLEVMGDVDLYKDFFSRMYNPLDMNFNSVRYSLDLLEVATHLGYDDLMSSICLYLASICRWTYYEEMRIRKAVSSDAFPRGHAKDLLERLEGSLTREDFRPLMRGCMQSLQPEGGKFLRYLLKTAGKQERGAILTFEQEMTTIIIEEFNLLHVETKDEVKSKRGFFIKQAVRGMLSKLEALVGVYEIMLATGTEVEDVESILTLKRLKDRLDRVVDGRLVYLYCGPVYGTGLIVRE